MVGKKLTLIGCLEEGECKMVLGKSYKNYLNMGKLP